MTLVQAHHADVTLGGLDWESEKRRILAALESEGEAEGDASGARRLEVEQIIRTTDQAIGDKEREIAELKHLLENQSSNLGSVAVGAAALGSILDADNIVCEERENLSRLQAEWRDKLRQAEIEISVERAKLARQRAELEERARTLTIQPQRPQSDPEAKPEPPVRGRWRESAGFGRPLGKLVRVAAFMARNG